MELAQDFPVVIGGEKEAFEWEEPNDFKKVFKIVYEDIKKNPPEALEELITQKGEKKSFLLFDGIIKILGKRIKISGRVENVYLNLTQILEVADYPDYKEDLEIYRGILDEKLKKYKVNVILEKKDEKEGGDFYFKFKLPQTPFSTKSDYYYNNPQIPLKN